jgi:hypothetical protein
MEQRATYTNRAAEVGVRVNSYLIGNSFRVIVVTTKLLVSDIAAFRARLDALQKPLVTEARAIHREAARQHDDQPGHS